MNFQKKKKTTSRGRLKSLRQSLFYVIHHFMRALFTKVHFSESRRHVKFHRNPLPCPTFCSPPTQLISNRQTLSASAHIHKCVCVCVCKYNKFNQF